MTVQSFRDATREADGNTKVLVWVVIDGLWRLLEIKEVEVNKHDVTLTLNDAQ